MDSENPNPYFLHFESDIDSRSESHIQTNAPWKHFTTFETEKGNFKKGLSTIIGWLDEEDMSQKKFDSILEDYKKLDNIFNSKSYSNKTNFKDVNNCVKVIWTKTYKLPLLSNKNINDGVFVEFSDKNTIDQMFDYVYLQEVMKGIGTGLMAFVGMRKQLLFEFLQNFIKLHVYAAIIHHFEDEGEDNIKPYLF
jgi:hypothetical protein